MHCCVFIGRLLGQLPLSGGGQRGVQQQQRGGLVSVEGFELLGLKWLPSLSNNQAKELTPFEVGDRGWRASIQSLTSGKATLIYYFCPTNPAKISFG